ncbi:hypothetical protein V1478_012440 [Vespula squamosa]|uniref:Uncharacterized protein n=1 Tax=Vespula squamosa TaxID=30214 RepID=A0ABD2AD66_VESSQ
MTWPTTWKELSRINLRGNSKETICLNHNLLRVNGIFGVRITGTQSLIGWAEGCQKATEASVGDGSRSEATTTAVQAALDLFMATLIDQSKRIRKIASMRMVARSRIIDAQGFARRVLAHLGRSYFVGDTTIVLVIVSAVVPPPLPPQPSFDFFPPPLRATTKRCCCRWWALWVPAFAVPCQPEQTRTIRAESYIDVVCER